MSRISLDQMFTADFLKNISDKENMQMMYITSTILPMEEYADKIGYIRALRECRDNYKRMLKEYFNNDVTIE